MKSRFDAQIHAAIGFTEEDLKANRDGKLTEAQRQQSTGEKAIVF